LLMGGGLVQVRDRTWTPPSQKALQGPQGPQSVKLPLTVKNKRQRGRRKLLNVCRTRLKWNAPMPLDSTQKQLNSKLCLFFDHDLCIPN